MSVAVMQTASAWFNSYSRHDLSSSWEVVAGILSTPNWYATPEGRRYIRNWHAAERGFRPETKGTPGRSMGRLEHAIRGRNLPATLVAFYGLYSHEDWDRNELGGVLSRLALESGSPHAAAIAEVYAANLRTLWNDTNYSGQCVYILASGQDLGNDGKDARARSAVQLTALPTDDLQLTALDASAVQLTASDNRTVQLNLVPPGWAADGIHCAGSDPRFSGVLVHMARACDAFEHFGRLDPEDDWSRIPDPISPPKAAAR